MAVTAETESAADQSRLLDGRYRIRDRLGKGGMGEVYRAIDTTTGRELAVKTLLGSATDRANELKFRREFHTLARLRHPRIIEVFDYSSADGRSFYTMELLDGEDLRDVAPAEPPRACRLLRDVATALAFLHSRQLLHRDVAPRNVRCTSDDRAKLLDFGVLATIGVANEVVGTLPCIAPETLHGVPLDQRSDLFGLGALAYWLLTGKHARRIRRLEDLVGRTGAPPPPSSHVEGIPESLDDLVMSLLSEDPLGRPSTAAEVIDRLGAIGGLEPEAEIDVARGYVASAGLVGRKREMAVARRRIERLLDGRGRSVVIRGRAGSGKTRLLAEIGLEAKLAGALVVRTDASAGGPYGVARKLAREVATAASELARDTASDLGGALARALPNLVDELGLPRPDARKTMDPREERLLVQRALADWFVAISRRRPLVIMVDDLQRVDEASAAFLASLSHQTRSSPLLLLSSLHTSEAIVADEAVGKLREQSLGIRARGLRAEDIETLVKAMFGDVKNTGHLARWMRGVAGGSPLQATELARSLVDRGTIRFAEGLWVIPDTFDEGDLPHGLRDAMDARISRLGTEGKSLARALSVLQGEVSLDDCVELSGKSAEKAFEALDELVNDEVLVGSGDRYRFRHEGLREALLRSLDAGERARFERSAGELMAKSEHLSPESDAQVGWHLLRGGEERAGAERLERVGTRLFEATSFRDAIPPLEAAYEVLRDASVEPKRRVDLLTMLVTAGFYADRATAVKFRNEAVEVVGRYAGVARARRLRRFFGLRVGMVLALVITAAAYWLFGRRRGSIRPVDAIRAYLRVVGYSSAVAGFSFDTAGIERGARDLRELAALRRLEISSIERFCNNLLRFNLGRIRALLESSDEGIRYAEASPEQTSEAEIKVALGGARFQRGLAHSRSGGSEMLREIEAMDDLGLKLWDTGALQLRSILHMWHGREKEAQRIWSEAELEFVRLGSVWQIDATYTYSATSPYGYTGDVIGLKRCIEALSRNLEKGFNVEQHIEVARAEYHRARGELDRAREAIDRALVILPAGEGLLRASAMSCDALIHLESGDFEDAKRAAEAALAHASDPEYSQAVYRYRSGATLALADAELGNCDAAFARLRDLIEEAEPLDNALVSGTLHEAAARVALAGGDRVAFEEHSREVDDAFRSTENPVLIARAERLLRSARLPESVAKPAQMPDIVTIATGDAGSIATSLLSRCHTAKERATRALDLILQGSAAPSGYLYLVRRGKLEVVAPLAGDEPPAGQRLRLQELVSRGGVTESTLGDVETSGGASWRPILLRLGDGDGQIVGAAAVADAPSLLVPPLESLLNAVARSLYDEGDVVTTPSTATVTLVELEAMAEKAGKRRA